VRGELLDLVAGAGAQPAAHRVQRSARHTEAKCVGHRHPARQTDAGGGEQRVPGRVVVQRYEYGTHQLHRGLGLTVDEDCGRRRPCDQDAPGSGFAHAPGGADDVCDLWTGGQLAGDQFFVAELD
jgi:hypothetical protein